MRVDATNLLNRLGRQDFSYKEFEDRFSELELWPLLEALVKDPRLVELAPSPAAISAEPKFAESQISLPSEEIPKQSGSAEPVSIAAMFRHYEQQSSQPPKPAAPAAGGHGGTDVRALLHRLSELGARGDI